MSDKREHWGSKLGIILAVAGSAVGLGNFIKFPGNAVANGGGAFMIPYFIAFLLLGIPLMWVEWTLGRIGGLHGHGTAPGIFDAITKNRFAKYLGSIGVVGPFIILIYYVYVECWTLAYSVFSFSGKLFECTTQEQMVAFRDGLFGFAKNDYFSSMVPIYIFFIIAFALNFWFIYKGINGGIEKLSRYGMPLLLILAVILTAKVLTLGAPIPGKPELSVANGLGFFWNPDFSVLKDPGVWLNAAGQIFFTLSVGIGVILTYASYLKRDDDVTLSGLTAASTNEFCEVILGGSLIVPAAFIFLGGAEAAGDVVKSGSIFSLGFVTMPFVFQQMPMGSILCGIFFFLLFIAGITSSVSLIQPMISFLEDEFKMSREKSTLLLAVVSFVACQPTIFYLGNGFLDELDFWGGNFFLVLFATVEIILFAWVLGVERGWEEMHEGSQLKVPGFYKYITKYITPLYLFVILGYWLFEKVGPTFMMEGVSDANKPYILGARILIIALLAAVNFMILKIWNKKQEGI